MSIKYETTKFTAPADTASEVIRESVEMFDSQGINPMSKNGMAAIYQSKNLFEQYANKLAEGFDTDAEKEFFLEMMDNGRNLFLAESTIANVDPIAPLHGPMLRKYLPKLVITESIPTEPVSLPKFKLDYFEPYYEDADGVRHDFKEYFRAKYQGNLAIESLPRIWGNGATERHQISIFNAGINPITGKTAAGAIAQWNSQPITHAGYSGGFVAKGVDADELDTSMIITQLRIDLGNNNAGGFGTLVDIDVVVKPDVIKNNFYYELSYTVPEEIVAAGDITGVNAGSVVNDTLFGNYDPSTKLLKLVSANGVLALGFNNGNADPTAAKIVQFKIDSKISNQWNEKEEGSVGFTIRHKDILIPHNQHINAPFGIEYLQDLKAMYDMDGTLKVVEIMSEFFAQKVEYEGWKFLVDSYVNNELANNGWFAAFNVQPYASFAGRPSEWREEFKRIIDYIAGRIKNTTNFPGGVFVIFGNPLDLNVIENANWTFVGADSERSGVNVEFSVGVFKGAYNYRLVASPQIPQGNLRMMFYPGGDDHMTYKMYTYSFNVVTDNSFRSPKHSNVPNIMMVKRYAFEEFTPVQAVLQIDNNVPESMLGYAPNPTLPSM